MSVLKIKLFNPNDYLTPSFYLKLDKGWSGKHLGEYTKQIGVYIIFTEEDKKKLYVGKTNGKTMDFATRLYRHVTKKASSNSRVYQYLKKISNKNNKIKVALITENRIKDFFSLNGKLNDKKLIDIFEQVLIYHLNPELQREKSYLKKKKKLKKS